MPIRGPHFILRMSPERTCFALRFPEGKKSGQFRLKGVTDFRVFGCQHYPDNAMERSEDSNL